MRRHDRPSTTKKDHVKSIPSPPLAGGDGAFDGDFLDKGIHEADIKGARYWPLSERVGWQDCARAVDLGRFYYELYFNDEVSMEANPRLQPEKIRTEELVWEQDLRANFRLSVSGHANQFTDLINQETDPSTGLLVFNNSQRVHSKGLEIEFGGKTDGGIEGRVSYALQKTESLDTGLWLPDSPAQLAKANVVFPIARRRLALGFGLQYCGPVNTLAGGQAGHNTISNLTMTSREFAGGFRFSATVYNLFNSPYSAPVGAEIVGSTVRQNGRDFRVQLTHIFHFQ